TQADYARAKAQLYNQLGKDLNRRDLDKAVTEERHRQTQESAEKGEIRGVDRLASVWAERSRGRFLCVEGGNWRTYQDDHWTRIGTEFVQADVHRFLRFQGVTVNPSKVSSVLSLAPTDLGITRVAELNAHAHLIP